MMRVAVGKDVIAPVAMDHAALASHVARKAGVTGGIEVARDDMIALAEARPPTFDFRRISAKLIRGLRRDDRIGAARDQLLTRDFLFLHQQRHHRVEPSLVVTRIEVDRRGNALDRVPELVGVAELAREG